MNRPIWKIDAEVLEDGRHRLYYVEGTQPFPGLRLLKRCLFGWHEASYYGMTIDESAEPDRYGFILPASQAVGYWNEPPVLAHGTAIEWGAGAEDLRRFALLLKQVLAQGWFVPAVACDPADEGGSGRLGWRLLRGGEDHPDPAFAAECERAGYPALDRRLSETLADLVVCERPIAEAWRQVTAAHPPAALLAARASAADFADEYELWEAVGFRADNLSFAVGLRLEEPDAVEGGWRLLPWVYDRAAPERGALFDWRGAPLERTETPLFQPSGEPAAASAAIDRLRGRWANRIDGLTEPWETERVWRFLEGESGELLAQGVRVLLPAWWEDLRKTRPAMVAKLRSDAGASGLLGKDQLLAFDWTVAVGGNDLDIAAFRAAVRENRKLLRHNGRWLVLHPKWVRLLQDFLQRMGKRESLTLAEVVETYLSGGHTFSANTAGETADGRMEERESELQWQVRLNAPVAEWLASLEDKERRQESAALPESLRPVLRGYQAVGTSWLLSLRRIGFGACLADDMGLGKTLQFIAYLAALKQRGELDTPGLLVCPTSVIGNWQKEAERFAPELRVYLHYGARRETGEAFACHLEAADLVITSYALAHTDAERLSERKWSVIGLDEAQNIKNRHGKQSRAIRGLRADHCVALTGTPVENRLAELWTIFDFINPAYLGSFNGFQRRFGFLDKPPAAGEAADRREEAERKLQRMIRPFLMRRVKTDPAIRLDLPEKHENAVYIPLTAEQGALYEAELRQMLDAVETLDAMERKGLILATLGRLKQICDHPALVRKEAGSRSQPASRSGSGASHKLDRLVEMVGEALDERRKGIIFTQFVGMGEILRQELQAACNGRVDFLHGGLSKEARDRMVDRFQQEQGGTDFLILSLKAGGTGLNLTAATHVFHYDRWWNPAVEEQATDRAYRIGQSRDVQVHKFIALGTVEERIDEMIRRKKTLSARIVGSGEAWVTELTTDELRDMFALRREWVRD